MNKFRLVAGLVLALGLLAPRVQAAEFIAPGPGQQGAISVSGENHRNVYVAAGSVTVSSSVAGDLYAAGGKVLVTGNVEQDLVVGGGSVTLNGTVGGDVRAGGGDITITGAVTGDVIVGGGSVTIAPTASIGGDLVIGSGDVIVEAPVTGTARIAGGTVYINSAIAGSVWAQTDKELRFGPNANVQSAVTHKGRTEAVREEGAQVPSITFEKYEHKSASTAALARVVTGAFVIKLLAWLLAAWLLTRFFPRRVRTVVEGVRAKPWLSLGIGFLGLIAFPVAIFLLLLTFVGYYVAFIALLWFILALFINCLIAMIVVGALVEKWLMRRAELQIDWQAVAIGVVIVSILAIIPVIGWLIMALIMMMTFGSFLRMVGHQLKLEREDEIVVEISVQE